MSYGMVLIIVTVVWLVSLYKFNFEILSPASLFPLGLAVSCALAIVGKDSWNSVDEISLGTIQIIIIGCLSFAVGCLISARIANRIPVSTLKIIAVDRRETSASIVRYESLKYAIFYGIIIIAIALRVYETFQIAKELGFDSTASYFEVTRMVRDETAVFNSAESIRFDVGFSLLERQLEKIAVALGYVSVYLLSTNIGNWKNIKQILPSAGLLLLSSVFVLSTGSRSTILFYIIAYIACYSIMSIKNGASPRKVALRVALYGILAALIGSLVFFLMGGLVGRSTSSGIVRYVSFYFGSGIPAFQQLLDCSAPEVTVPGLRSFYYAYSLLYKLGIISNFPGYSLGWINLGGLDCNVFTGFARYYFDFGLAGVVILSLASGLILSAIYLIARITFSPSWVLVLCYLTPRFFDMAREEFVFSRLLSSTQIISIIIMIALLAIYYYEPKQGALSFSIRKRN